MLTRHGLVSCVCMFGLHCIASMLTMTSVPLFAGLLLYIHTPALILGRGAADFGALMFLQQSARRSVVVERPACHTLVFARTGAPWQHCMPCHFGGTFL